jgi:hypothetical protein
MKVGALHAGAMLAKMQRARRVSGHHTRLEQRLALLDVCRWKIIDRRTVRHHGLHRELIGIATGYAMRTSCKRSYQGYAALVGMVRHIAAIDAKAFMTTPS